MSIQIKNTPVLFIKSDNQDVLKEILIKVKSVLNSTLDSDKIEEILTKIQQNSYVDFNRLDGNIISKEDILALQEKCFAQDISGDGYKFYLIDNIDKTNKFIQNSLLKFIEEPPMNTFSFFSANNVNNVLKTIISRCYVKNIQGMKEYQINHSTLNTTVLGVINSYNSLFYLQDVKHFVDEFKKLNYKEIEEFLNNILDDNNFKKSDAIYELLSDIKLNLNKNLIIFKLLKLKGF